MASDWMIQEVNQATGKPTQPTVATPQPKQTVSTPTSTPSFSPAPTTPAAAPVPKPTVANPHGSFMSGSLLNKAFDILRLPEYAIASFDKGQENAVQQMKAQGQGLGPSAVLKGVTAGIKNIIPGIATRTQFGRENGDYNPGKYLTSNPIGQSAINLGTSLAAPSLPVGKIASTASKIITPVAKVASKIPFVQKGIDLATKIGNTAVDYAKTNPTVTKAVESIPGLEYFRNPEVGQILQYANDQATSRVSGLFNRINDMAKGLSSAERVKVGNLIEGGVPTDATAHLSATANYIKNLSDNIGKELVDNGIMSQDTFDKYKGQYLSHIADIVKNETISKGGNPIKFFMNSLKERGNVLGTGNNPDYIREFQFPVFKALAGEIKTIESTKAVKQIADKFGQNVEPQTSATDLAHSLVNTMMKDYKGPRKGLGMGENLAADTGNVNPLDIGKETGGFQKPPLGGGPRVSPDGLVALEDLLPDKIGRMFKGVGVPQEVADYVKRTYTPSSQNLLERIGNKAMDMWKLGKTIYSGPAYHMRNLESNMILSDMATGAGLPKTLYNYGRAVKAYLGQGDAKMNQYLQELKDAGIINHVDISEGVDALHPNMFNKGENVLQKIISAPSKFQNASEETAKLNVYSYFRNKGMSIKDAANRAEEAIFSPYKISARERGLVKGAVPFYSFTRQALPFTVKTAFSNPGRLTKYEKGKTAIEGLSPEGADNNQNLPDNMNGQIRLPIKDKDGNYTYYDPTYTLPYGNFGDVGKGLPFGLSFNPFAMEAFQQMANKDFYFDQPIAKSAIPERANVQRAQHVFQTLAPNMSPTDITGIPTGQDDMPLRTRAGDKIVSAFTNKPDYAGRTRSRTQAILDTFGQKSAVYRPQDQQKFDAIDKQKQLQAIKKEYYSTVMDQSKTLAQKQKILQRLREVQAQTMAQ